MVTATSKLYDRFTRVWRTLGPNACEYASDLTRFYDVNNCEYAYKQLPDDAVDLHCQAFTLYAMPFIRFFD